MADSEVKLEMTAWERWPVSFPGQGIAVGPAGEVYVSTGHYIVIYDTHRKPSVFAGQTKVERFKEGHRLTEAGFRTLGGLRYIEDSLYFCDRKASIIGYIDNDQVVRYAGNGDEGRRDGPRLDATFSYPTDVISYRGKILISDYDSKHIRVIDEAGMVTSISADGSPFALCSIGDDEALFVTCHMHNYIREVDLEKRTTRVIAGTGNEGSLNGMIETATFYRPRGMVCAGEENTLYVVDCLNHRIRQLTTSPIPDYTDEVTASEINHPPYHTSLKMTPVPNSVGWKYVYNLTGTVNSSFVTYPYFMVVTPDGELIWSDEQNSRLVSIKDFTSPSSAKPTLAKMTAKNFVSFELLLEQDNDASQMRACGTPVALTHANSGASLQVEPQLLNLALDSFSNTGKSVLESTFLPFETVELFLKLMYGTTEPLASLEAESKCMTCIRLLMLLRSLELDVSEPLYAYITAEYLASLDSLDLPTLLKVTIFIVLNSIESPELLYATDAIKKAQYNFKKWPGKRGTTPLSEPWDSLTTSPFTHELESQWKAATKDIDPKEAMTSANEIVASLALKVLPHDFFIHSSQKYIFPFGKLQSNLEELAEKLHFKHVNDPIPESDCLLAIGITGYDQEVVVHDWIVWSRWKYLRLALGAGGVEASNRRLELPSYFPATLLIPLLQFIYTGGTILTHPLSDSDCLFVMVNGAEFNLFEPNEFHGLARTTEDTHDQHEGAVTAIRGPRSTAPQAMPGFVTFIGHSRSRLLRALTVENCLPSLEYRLICGHKRQADMALAFIEREWHNIKNMPEAVLRAHMDALGDNTKEILEKSGIEIIRAKEI